MINNCPVDGRIMSGYVNGQYVESDIIDCANDANYPASCVFTLRWFINQYGNVWEVTSTAFKCGSEAIYIDNVRCFYDGSALECPLIDTTKMIEYSSGGQTFLIPDTVPVQGLMLR
jgi:hypothetical protein